MIAHVSSSSEIPSLSAASPTSRRSRTAGRPGQRRRGGQPGRARLRTGTRAAGGDLSCGLGALWLALAGYRSGNVFCANPELNAATLAVAQALVQVPARARAELVAAASASRSRSTRGASGPTSSRCRSRPGSCASSASAAPRPWRAAANDETYPAHLERMLRARHPGSRDRGAQPGRERGDDRALARPHRPCARLRARRDRAVRRHQRHRLAPPAALRDAPTRCGAGPTAACSPSGCFRSRSTSSSPSWRAPSRRSARRPRSAASAGSATCWARSRRPDLARASADFRRHLDVDTEFWTQRWGPGEAPLGARAARGDTESPGPVIASSGLRPWLVARSGRRSRSVMLDLRSCSVDTCQDACHAHLERRVPRRAFSMCRSTEATRASVTDSCGSGSRGVGVSGDRTRFQSVVDGGRSNTL